MGTVQLPAATIISKQTGLHADLRTSLRFSQDQSENGGMRCADDIIRLRTEEKLWIVPATPCRIRISIQLLGRISNQTLDIREAASWIERCEIWGRLGLRVRYCERPGDSSVLEFSLQHPDLSASSSCPAAAAKARLDSVLCQIEVTRPPETRNSKKRKRNNVDNRKDATLCPSTGLAYSSRSTDHISPTSLEEIAQAAITVLMTGLARNLANVSVRHGNTAHGLAKMIPSVFNVPYVKAISDRSQYAPVITNALRALQETAQSPALKRKVWNFADRGGVEKHLWHSILSQVKPASLPGPKSATARQIDSTLDNAVTDHGLGSNLICFGEDLFSATIQSGLGDDAETFAIKDCSPTVCIDYDALEETPPFPAGGFSEAVAAGSGGGTHFPGNTEDMIEFGSDFFAMEAYFDM